MDAAAGTVAHGLASKCWLLGRSPYRFIGEPEVCDGYEFVITEEMASAVDDYLFTIDSIDRYGYIETRIEHSSVPGFGGTVDYFTESTDRVHVADFKYGAGVPVDVVENEQLACYGLLAIDKFRGGEISDVTLTIVQPRAEHPDGPIRSWVASKEYLESLLERIYYVATHKGERALVAGKHCRWCPGKADCKELYQLTVTSAKDEFAEPGMTPELAASIMSKADSIRSYLDAVEKWAHGQLDKGVNVPGYKLVNSFGHRRFRYDEATILRKLRRKGLGKKQVYKSVMLSPTQLEKVVAKDVLAPLVERPHLGTTVVPETDKREAVKRLTVSDEFANLPENLGDLF
jgi:hypothetical protein